MKRIILAAALISGFSPSMAQEMFIPGGHPNGPGPQTPREIAFGKCFSDSPWVVPAGYYETCLAKAKAAK